jgi:DNA-directed RNA polymerase specialized sigma24 family protein
MTPIVSATAPPDRSASERGDCDVNASQGRAVAMADRERFLEIVDSHWSAVFRYVRGMVASTQAAEDITQEAYTIALRRLDSLREPGMAGAWVMAIAVNLARYTRTRAAKTQRPAPSRWAWASSSS